MSYGLVTSRGIEEIEVEREELTEPNFRGNDADLRDPERFFRYALARAVVKF